MAIFRTFCRFARCALVAVCSFVFAFTDNLEAKETGVYVDRYMAATYYTHDCPKGCICPGCTYAGWHTVSSWNVQAENYCARNINELKDKVDQLYKDYNDYNGRITCKKVENSDSDGLFADFDRCPSKEERTDCTDDMYRCPENYPLSELRSTKREDCYVYVPEHKYIAVPKGNIQDCPSDKYCPEQYVHYGQVSETQDKYQGTIMLDMNTNDGCCTIEGTPTLYAKVKQDGNYALYTSADSEDAIGSGDGVFNIKCNGCDNAAFVGMYDISNKQRMKKNGQYLVLTDTNSYYPTTLFPTGKTATWTAKYDRAYTVKLEPGTGGAGGTTEFKVFAGKAYQAGGFNINNDTNASLDQITRPSSNLGYIFNGYYYNGEQLIDAEGYPTSIFNDVVRNISRDQTWNASWEIVHTIYLNPNNGGTSVSKYSVLGGRLYEFNDLSKEINIVTDIQAKQNNVDCNPKLSAGELPTYAGRGFAGYYRSDDQMINSEGCPTVNFVGEVQGMDGIRTWNAKWVKYYTVTLKNGCSESDKGCVTQFEVHENAVPFKTKEIMEDGKEDEVDPPVKITKIDIIPTKTSYTFEGYYYSGEQMIDRNGNFTSLGTAEMMDMTSNKSWTASWAYCNPSTGGVHGNACSVPGKGEYLDNGEKKPCPGYKNGAFSANELYPSVSVEKEWFEFTTYSQAGLGKGRCAIRYNPEIDPENKGLCGNGTKVIYAWNESDGNYKLIDDHYVLAGNLAGNSDNDLETDFTDENVSKIEKDYCGACGKNGADDQYNVGGMGCGYCNNGYCIDKHNTCIKCPAGYACPGPEQGETGNLECDHRENQYSIPTLYCRGDQYSMEGATVCSDCAEGYSTMNSSTSLCAIQIAGSGVGCTSVRACVPVPPYLVKKDLTNIGDNPRCGPSYSILSRRSNCNRSFGLGSGVKMLKKYTGYAREYLPPDYTPVPSDSDD